MDQASQTMIDNLQKNTGKSLDDWISIVRKEKLQKHGDILKFLKTNHQFTHGFANLVAHKTLKSDAASATDENDLIMQQYKGKEHFLPLYRKLRADIEAMGKDIEFAPKKSYISVRRKKQFAMLVPATKIRYELGINLKGQVPSGLLLPDTKSSGMVTHRIVVNHEEQYSKEVLDWLKKAYDAAG
ncbi:DUF4287 domain-containing protein [Algoriphagus halophytocola]|uniref:DUF4287 domain-containing protein n=1 Tax=Algoriphagus halophytocola TaxID=2991499 RepID=A0ABY6MHS4_9BACT|nr:MULTISPECIES: DUF4287 domain-containing protein [unclassified Algoriphagus]UZD23325.1 DUF4287 domain-containing protein [Algoriphagus sp. TR-M5]WBL44620.1 DUF4287 domain-containing protein [Algoriphagus sp. TR-M9]